MIIYIAIVLFIIIIFLDFQYRQNNVIIPPQMQEGMHSGGGGHLSAGQAIGSRTSGGPNLAELNNNTLSQDDSLSQVQAQVNWEEKKRNEEIQDLMGSVYEPPTESNIEGIEGYTSYNNFSYAMSKTPPLSVSNSTNTHQQRPAIYTQNFHDFSKFGKIPPDPVATTCFLDFGCVNYPYSEDERNGNVCKRCIPNPMRQNYDQPQTYVMGREAGLPRQIRGVF